ncbi:unnamed protein product [Boreogadus saida]
MKVRVSVFTTVKERGDLHVDVVSRTPTRNACTARHLVHHGDLAVGMNFRGVVHKYNYDRRLTAGEDE